jgi:hypothetical protein
MLLGILLMVGMVYVGIQTGNWNMRNEPVEVAANATENMTPTHTPTVPTQTPVILEVPVVVTANPEPDLPTDTPIVETVFVVVTATPLPATQTSTPTTTETPAPSSLGVGDEWSDGRVMLRMTKSKFNPEYHIPGTNVYYAISFIFELENISGETILLRYASEDFSMVDDNGREYACRIHYANEISEPVASFTTHTFIIGCGRDLVFDGSVHFVTLTVAEFSSLPSTKWIIEVPH